MNINVNTHPTSTLPHLTAYDLKVGEKHVLQRSQQEFFSEFRHFVLFKDDFSKVRHVYFIQSHVLKDKLVQMIKKTKNAGHTIKTILSNDGGEFHN